MNQLAEALLSSHLTPGMSSLTLVLDLCPAVRPAPDLQHWLSSVLAFANSFLLLSERNSLTVIACHLDVK